MTIRDRKGEEGREENLDKYIFFEERRPREGRDARDTCLPRKLEGESGGLNRRESGIGVSWGE